MIKLNITSSQSILYDNLGKHLLILSFSKIEFFICDFFKASLLRNNPTFNEVSRISFYFTKSEELFTSVKISRGRNKCNTSQRRDETCVMLQYHY